jgi:hypothetical protein
MPRLSREEVRRTRLHPRRSDYLYLHLSRLRDAVRAELESIPAADVLDVYCGARPYEPLLGPTARCVGLDVRRVLRPGGELLITIPAAYPGDPGPYSPAQLRELLRAGIA